MSEGTREAETRPRMTSINHGERSDPVSRRDVTPPSEDGRGGGVINDPVDRWDGGGALIDLFRCDCHRDGDSYYSDDGSSLYLEEEKIYRSYRVSLEERYSDSRIWGTEARKLPSSQESTEETPQLRTSRKMTTDSWAAEERGGGDDSDSAAPSKGDSSKRYETKGVRFAAPADYAHNATKFALSASSSRSEISRGRKSGDGRDHSGDWDAEETSGTVTTRNSAPLRSFRIIDATAGADTQTTVVAANRAVGVAVNEATPTGGESKFAPDSSKDASPRQPKRRERRKFSFGFFGAKRKKVESSDATRLCHVAFRVESASFEKNDVTASTYGMSEGRTDDTVPLDFPWRYPIQSLFSGASECDGWAGRVSGLLSLPSTKAIVDGNHRPGSFRIVRHRPGSGEKKKGTGKGMSRWNVGEKDEKKQGAAKEFSFLRLRRRTKKKKTYFVMTNDNLRKLVEKKLAKKPRRRTMQERRSSKANEAKWPHRIRKISSEILEKTKRKEYEKGVNTNKALNDFAAGTRSGATTPRKATDKNSAESKRTTNELRRKSARTERYRSPSETRAGTPAGGTGNAAETAVVTERRGRIPKDDGGRGRRRSSTAGGRGGAPHALRRARPTDAGRGREGLGDRFGADDDGDVGCMDVVESLHRQKEKPRGRRRSKGKHVRVPELSLYWKQIDRTPMTKSGTYLRTVQRRGTGKYVHSQRNQPAESHHDYRPSAAEPGRVHRLR